MALRGLLGLVLAALLLLCTTVSGETCQDPRVTSSTYTTTDATVVVNIAFIAEFSVKCANNVKNLNLYADINGRIIPVTKSQDDAKYQVSWTEDPKKVSTGEHKVNIFDEEGYAALRKAQRSSESSTNVPSLFVLSIVHQGTYNGPWIQGEFMATGVAVIVWYMAYSAKAKLQS